MAIVSGTVTSAPVQGVSVQAAADENPPNAFGIVGKNGNWVLSPGPNAAISNLGTAVATATASLVVDWTTASFFTCTAYGGGWTITFKNAAGIFTPTVGQIIFISCTAASSSVPVFPATITWITAATPTAATNSQVWMIICTNAGSSPTFIGFTIGDASTAAA